jgi:DNA-binding SARP family transcriptional activator
MLTLTPGGYRLQVDHEQLDLLAYRSRLAQARRVSAVDPQQGFDILSAALDLWQGHSPVQDVAEMHGDPLFIALCDDMIDATLQLGQLAETLQRLPEVLPRLRRLAARHVWHEGLHARLIVALAVSGQRAAGFDVYDGIRRRLLDDLGVDPGPELVKARQGLVNQRGEEAHRTAVVTQPHRMAWQAPASPASFTGRADELLRLERLLRFSERRSGAHPTTLCVISGMPGVGKTSLALRAAQSVRADFPDGQLYL